MYVTTHNDDMNDDDDDCDDDRLWWKMWKKIGIEHSRTDMTEMKQTSSSKGKLQQNFTIPIHSDEMRW